MARSAPQTPSLLLEMLEKLQGSLKLYFVTGLFVLVPVLLTVMVMGFVINQFDALLIPEYFDRLIGFHIPGLGVLVMIVLTFATGLIARNLLGKQLIQWGERLVSRVPLAGAVYQGTKQLMNAVFIKDANAFRQVVLLEFPQSGIYSIGFVTGSATEMLSTATRKKLVNVFIPMTPNPTSGFFLMVPEEQLIPLPLSTPEAFRLILSAGIVIGSPR